MRQVANIRQIIMMMLLFSIASIAVGQNIQVDSILKDTLVFPPHKVQQFSGSSDLINRYTPQSPQTAALLKYTEFPVSPATGIPNIDIPIYTIEWDGVRVPISVSYHASGIKVNDVASPVGLGWVLNAGGAIGCSTNGTRDDNTSQIIKSADEFKQKLQAASITSNVLREIANGIGTIDTESDRYQYNFNGHNGCFRYDYTDMSLKPIPYEPIKIEKQESGGFKITDGDGTQYLFSLTETVGMGNITHRSACYLTNIVTPMKQDTINFIYGKTSVYYQTLASEYQHSGTYYDWDEENAGDNVPYLPLEGPVSEYVINRTIVNYATPLLTSIVWKGNKVEFNYSDDRPEYKLQRERLTQIQIKDYTGTIVSTTLFDNTGVLGTSQREKRMLLKSITMTGTNSTASNPIKYSFGYNMNALPEYIDNNDVSTVRFHEDYWGYYNGTTSQHAVPKEYTANSTIGGNDRMPDDKYAQYGILTSVTYPTGGTSSFSYEGNVATELCGGLRVKEISNSYQGKLLDKEVFSYPENGETYLDISEDLYRYSTYYYYYREMQVHSNNSEWESDEHVVSQSSPILSLTGWNGNPVFYKKVTRSYYDDANNLCGKTESQYIDAKKSNSRCSGLDNQDYPRFYSELYNCDTGFPQPLLIDENHYQYVDGKASLISNSNYSYKEVQKDDFPIGVRVYKDDVEVVYFSSQGSDSYVPYPSRTEFVNSFHYHDVYAIPTFYVLQSKSSVNYETGEKLSETYQYDNSYRSFKPTEISRLCSDGKTMVISYTYPFNASGLTATGTSSITEMLSRHQNDIVLGEKVKKGENNVSQEEYGYAYNGNRLNCTSYSYSIGGSTLEKRVALGNFDATGNPRSLVRDNALEQIVLWGYKYQYPVMLITGIPFASLSSQEACLSRIGNSNVPADADMNIISQTVANLGGHCVQYKYQPLVGLISTKEPSGKTSTYAYDALGRVSSIKNTDGQTTHAYSYYYNNGGNSSHSYVQSKTFLDTSLRSAIIETSYLDGMGREISTSTTGLSSSGKVAQAFVEYDGMHRVSKRWLPAILNTANDNVSLPNLQSQIVSTYTDNSPYSLYEYGGENYTLTTIPPGTEWHTGNHGSKSLSGYYEANTLFETTITDEDGKQIKTFKDMDGKKILERSVSSEGNLDTYYVYDDFALLRFVLSPQYQEETDLQKFAYQYVYDHRGRIVKKTLPGCEYQQLWYDSADNLMFSQDGEQRKKNIYTFYLYDNLMRPVLQGTTSAINTSCNSAIANFNTSNTGLLNSGYTAKESLDLQNVQLLQANYYDNHEFLNGQLSKQATSQNLSAEGIQTDEKYNKGLQTGNICIDTNGKLLVSAYYHNAEGLVVLSKQTMIGDALHTQTTSYTFTKKPQMVKEQVNNGNIVKTIIKNYTYNKYNDQIESITLDDGNSSKKIASYLYDDLGRLLSNTRSGSAGAASYEYNIHNWLVGITSPHFCQILQYNKNATIPYYNGNIARIQWKTSNDGTIRGYDFNYDDLNRLTESAYAEGSDMSQNKNRYSENILSYSANGSIEILQRYGKKNDGTFGLIDDLSYQYNGNQVKAINDKAGSLAYDGSFDFKDGTNANTEYTYNTNGSLVTDLNKGISSIEYDVLGNLKCIIFVNGFKTNYIYDAIGNKLSTSHTSAVTNTTDYVGNFTFEDGKLGKYLFEGGYCSFDSNLNPTYHYYEKDHLGSIRMVVNENGTIEQVTHYYPFGGIYGDLTTNSELQKNKYIGKEFDHIHGLDWYDHGARMYDAARGSWDRMDPFYGKYYPLSPYLYCGDNPILFKDNNGMDWYQQNGMYLYSPNVHSAKDLKKGQIYVGKEFKDYKTNTTYRQDGSILFSNERNAYQRMNKLSRTFSHSFPAGKEESAFLLNNGKVLMMADYQNSSTESKSPGYTFKGNKLSNKQNETFYVVGHIHTHQDMMFDKGMSNRDWNLAISHPNIPYFIIHADGNIYGGIF